MLQSISFLKESNEELNCTQCDMCTEIKRSLYCKKWNRKRFITVIYHFHNSIVKFFYNILKAQNYRTLLIQISTEKEKKIDKNLNLVINNTLLQLSQIV